MDIPQLVTTAVAVVGLVVVGLMAVVPSVMDAASGRDEPRSTTPAPTPQLPRRAHVAA